MLKNLDIVLIKYKYTYSDFTNEKSTITPIQI